MWHPGDVKKVSVTGAGCLWEWFLYMDTWSVRIRFWECQKKLLMSDYTVFLTMLLIQAQT